MKYLKIIGNILKVMDIYRVFFDNLSNDIRPNLGIYSSAVEQKRPAEIFFGDFLAFGMLRTEINI